jgi:copper chaperone CopZ
MAIILKVEGMHCEGCAARVKKVVEAKAVGSSVRVELDAGRVTVDGAPADADLAAIITDAGYPASLAR